jgi:hypothetical protein
MDCEDNYINNQRDFSHFQDTKVIWQEDDKKHSDPQLFSLYTVEIDISELYPLETFRHILRRVLIYAQDIDLAILHRISKFSHVEYELQRTSLVSDSDWEGIPLDIRCPLRHRIRDDTLDRAFLRIFERRGDLQCLGHFLLRAFFVLPIFIRMAGKGVLLQLII